MKPPLQYDTVELGLFAVKQGHYQSQWIHTMACLSAVWQSRIISHYYWLWRSTEGLTYLGWKGSIVDCKNSILFFFFAVFHFVSYASQIMEQDFFSQSNSGIYFLYCQGIRSTTGLSYTCTYTLRHSNTHVHVWYNLFGCFIKWLSK